MLRSKLVKGFVMGLGLTVILSTAAFAEEKAVSQDTPVSIAASATASSAVGTMPAKAPDAVSDAMYQKQGEIDKYLFEEHKDEIAARGITVTHTVAGKDFVEVGITPFTRENEDFIYKALGTDQVKVVEGTQAIAYAADGANGDEGLMYATGASTEEAKDDAVAPTDVKAVSAPVDAQLYTAAVKTTAAENGTTLSAATVTAIAAAILVLLAGIIYSARRVRTAKK